MTGRDDFEGALSGWFEAKAVPPVPTAGLERAVAATRRRTPRPAWLADLGSHWVGEPDAVGSKPGGGAIPRFGRRLPTTLVLLLVVAAVVGGAVLVGARLLQPTPLPAGEIGHLAYGIDGDIYVADWDGANPRRIADGLPVLDGPSPCGTIFGEGSMWSPDGRYLAYRSDHVGGSCPGTVHVVAADGHVVASFPGTGWRIAWSPDSTRVATWVELSRTIGIYGLDGVRQALLTLPDGFGPPGDYDPTWSPDGRSVLMRLAPPLPSEVWELPIDGGVPRHLPEGDPRSHWNARFSPDGAQVAMIDLDHSLVVAAADGSASRTLTSKVYFTMSGGAVWSPMGDRIVFADDTLSGTYELRVLDLASGSITSLGSVYGSDPLPLRPIAFSPDGDRILYSKGDALWSVDADGSASQILVSGTSWGDWQGQAPGS